MQELLRAKAFYVGDEVNSNTRIATRMSAGTGAAPGQAPPDLPSLLLDGRICYIGMPVSGGVSTCVLTSEAAGTQQDFTSRFPQTGLFGVALGISGYCQHSASLRMQGPHIILLSVLQHTECLPSISSWWHISHRMSKGRYCTCRIYVAHVLTI